ncbi:G patch domain-containing protein 4 [Musca vetustissima]|uniref:G patch domain-containing protein 4 n=1 Tax=Musca vetustissima TaxID=27455 RepID=UPI002AB7AC8A|nr:G patch domain-containing protein 4 [Musca vetustissima]
MDFARKILEKYGWKDGDGLGKTNSGISKALRANLKFDTAGFGVDQAATDFNNHWWERVFNDAANNVDIKQDGESITVDLKNEADGVEITTKGYSVKKLKKAKGESESYNNFIQSATLTSRGSEIEKGDRPEPSDIEIPTVNVLTDEELFKACGGRTAHKGARHGLKLSGKLARIEQQENELLAKMMEAKQNQAGVEENSTDNKKKKKQTLEKTNEESNVELTETSEKKKKKRKQKSDEDEELECNTVSEEIPSKPKKKKKYKQEKETTEDIDVENSNVTEEDSPIKHKKKKKQKEVEEENPTENVGEHKKKKKDKEAKMVEDSDIVEAPENIEPAVDETVSKKKKNKKKSKSKEE